MNKVQNQIVDRADRALDAILESLSAIVVTDWRPQMDRSIDAKLRILREVSTVRSALSELKSSSSSKTPAGSTGDPGVWKWQLAGLTPFQRLVECLTEHDYVGLKLTGSGEVVGNRKADRAMIPVQFDSVRAAAEQLADFLHDDDLKQLAEAIAADEEPAAAV